MENQPTKNLKLIIFIIVFGVIFLWIGPLNIINFFRGNYPAMKEKQLIGDVAGNNFKVQEVEETLTDLALNPGTIDGIMDDQTRAAIREFQKGQGIKQTGYIDAKTLDALTKQKESLVAAQAEAVKGQAPAASSTELAQGQSATAAAVTATMNFSSLSPQERSVKIQTILANHGFYKGAVDGKIGPKSKLAIKDFQISQKLKADGVVGPKTWDALMKLDSTPITTAQAHTNP